MVSYEDSICGLLVQQPQSLNWSDKCRQCLILNTLNTVCV